MYAVNETVRTSGRWWAWVVGADVWVLLKAQWVKGLHVDGRGAVCNHVGNGASAARCKADAVAAMRQVEPDAVVPTGAGQG